MIVFGYKRPQTGFIKAIPFLVMGAVMCLWPGMSMNIVVQIVGAVIVLLGIISAVFSLKLRASGFYSSMLVSSVIAVLFGCILLFNPEFFAKVLMYIIGFILLLFGFGQGGVLMSARNYVKLSIFNFILPFLCGVAGLFVLFYPFKSMETIVIFMGAALFLYGVSSLITAFRMRQAVKKFEEANAPAPDLEVDEEGFSSYEDVTKD